MDSIPENLFETHTLGATREWLVSARQVPAFRFTQTKFAGYSEARSGYRFVRRAPTISQILACTEGEGRVLVDGKWKRCPAGHVYVTPPRTLCAYEVQPRGHWKVCWVIFEETVRLPSLTAGYTPQLVQADTMGLHLAIEGLCHEAGGEGEPAGLELWAALIHREVTRILQPGHTDPRLSQLWLKVRQDLGGVWDLQRMSRSSGMSNESLRRLCQKHTGRPPLSQLTQLRMLFAADLLACTKEKISSIAARVGYEDAFAFSNAFKREMGQPPSQYRSRQNVVPSAITKR
jgi:AraC-like DNA-binding protein/quercetin dioxygenase-like cupin family protein